jgi:hypothetical protein
VKKTPQLCEKTPQLREKKLRNSVKKNTKEKEKIRKMRVKFKCINPNIGHFLHQELQYLIHILFTEKDDVTLLLPPVIYTENLYRWHYGILSVLEKKNDKFKMEKIVQEMETLENIRTIHPGHPKIIDINYISYLRDITFCHFSIDIKEKNQEYKVLYTREGDTNRRHIMNSDIVKDHFDVVLRSMNLSFEEQVRLFSKTTHFVSVESGAHFVNIMFMKPEGKVMNILTRTDFSALNDRKENYDSWQARFGTSSLISEFNLDTKALVRHPCSNGAACGDHDMHDHVIIDDKLKKDILQFLYKDRYLTVRHPGYHGFFSYCNMSLMQIFRFLAEKRYLPSYVDMSEMFTMFKKDETKDISSLFFKQKVNASYFLEKIAEEMKNDMQFTNYKNLKLEYVIPIFSSFFIPSDEIMKRKENIEKKYKLDKENTLCIFYRGLDKSTETILPTYQDVLDKVKMEVKDDNVKYLLQSDETEFFDFFSLSLKNNIIFHDEIKHVRKQKTSINHITDMDTKLELIKNFLAIVLIMSECKKVFFISGNISLWITLFRRNTQNIYQYLNGEWF